MMSMRFPTVRRRWLTLFLALGRGGSDMVELVEYGHV